MTDAKHLLRELNEANETDQVAPFTDTSPMSSSYPRVPRSLFESPRLPHLPLSSWRSRERLTWERFILFLFTLTPKVETEDQVLATFCGRETTDTEQTPGQEVVLSPGSFMSVTFRSDFSNEERFTGFDAHYMAVGKSPHHRVSLRLWR